MGFEKQKPQPTDLWTVERLMMLDPLVKYTAMSLRAFSDDYGRQSRTDWILRRAVYPRDEVSAEEFDSHLIALAVADVIVLYEVDGAEYYAMVNMPAVPHSKDSLFPEPPIDVQMPSRSHPDGFTAMEGEGAGGGASESEDREMSSRDLPSAFCPKHRNSLGTPEDCRQCGRARLAQAEVWRRIRRRNEGTSETGPSEGVD